MIAMLHIVSIPPWIQDSDSGFRKKFSNLQMQGGVENLERQGRNFIWGNLIFLDQVRGGFILTQK